MTMRLLALTASCFLYALSYSQQTDYRLDPSNPNNGFIPLDMGAGETFYVTTQTFGFDSSYVELMHCDAQQTVMNAGAYKLFNSLTFMNTAAKVTDGVLVGGGNLGFNDYAFLLKTDFQGDLQWYVHFDSLPFFQDQVIQLNTAGNDFSLYTYPGGEYREGFCRFTGTSASGPTSGVSVATAVDTDIRIYRAVPSIGGPGLDFVAGAGYENNQFNTKSVLLAEVSPAGANWMKFIDMGASGISEIEDVTSITYTSGGGYMLTGIVSGASSLEGFIMQVDQFGNVQWAKRYTDPSGTFVLSDAYELLNGDFLIAGRDASFLGVLMRIDASGTIIWQRQYLASGSAGIAGLIDFWVNDSNDLWVTAGGGRQLSLDQNGDGCDFISVTPVNVSTITPVSSTVPYTNSSLAPVVYNPTYGSRSPVHSWVNECVVGSVAENEDGGTAFLYPSPAIDQVRLSGVEVAQNERVDVLDATGRLITQMTYRSGVDINTLEGGTYLLYFNQLNRVFKVVKE